MQQPALMIGIPRVVSHGQYQLKMAYDNHARKNTHVQLAKWFQKSKWGFLLSINRCKLGSAVGNPFALNDKYTGNPCDSAPKASCTGREPCFPCAGFSAKGNQATSQVLKCSLMLKTQQEMRIDKKKALPK